MVFHRIHGSGAVSEGGDDCNGGGSGGYCSLWSGGDVGGDGTPAAAKARAKAAARAGSSAVPLPCPPVAVTPPTWRVGPNCAEHDWTWWTLLQTPPLCTSRWLLKRRKEKNAKTSGYVGLRHPNRGQLHPLRGSEGGVGAPPARAQLRLSEGQRVASEAGLRPAQTAQLPQRVPSEAARCARNYAQRPP